LTLSTIGFVKADPRTVSTIRHEQQFEIWQEKYFGQGVESVLKMGETVFRAEVRADELHETEPRRS
jgi:hypothetical protein